MGRPFRLLLELLRLAVREVFFINRPWDMRKMRQIEFADRI